MSAFATLAVVDSNHVIRFERTFRQPIATVWAAITESEHLDHWFPTTIDGPRASGATVDFRFREADDTSHDFQGEILEFSPPSVFAVQWGPETLRFELSADGTGTRMVFTATFAEAGIVARDAAGWHVCLDELDAHTAAGDGTAPSRATTPEWKTYFDHYAGAFGREYATVTGPD